MKKDMLGKRCVSCKKGKYIVKASSYYDSDRLVCTKCFHDLSRFKTEKELKKMKSRINRKK